MGRDGEVVVDVVVVVVADCLIIHSRRSRRWMWDVQEGYEAGGGETGVGAILMVIGGEVCVYSLHPDPSASSSQNGSICVFMSVCLCVNGWVCVCVCVCACVSLNLAHSFTTHSSRRRCVYVVCVCVCVYVCVCMCPVIQPDSLLCMCASL